MTLADVMAQLLASRAMNATELTVAIMEAGYTTKMTRKKLRDTVGETLRTDWFKREGDKWVS